MVVPYIEKSRSVSKKNWNYFTMSSFVVTMTSKNGHQDDKK